MPYIADIVNVLIFSFLGIILMIVGNMIIDQFIPGDFPTEIKKGIVLLPGFVPVRLSAWERLFGQPFNHRQRQR